MAAVQGIGKPVKTLFVAATVSGDEVFRGCSDGLFLPSMFSFSVFLLH